jgi:tetratricopeptide (TPR) repeat protein
MHLQGGERSERPEVWELGSMSLESGSSDRLEEPRRLLASGQLQEGLAGLQQIIAERPADAEAHALLGVALGMSGDTAGSVRHLETAIQLAPQQPTHRFNLGQVRERSGNPNGAVEAYRQALQIDPSYQRASEALWRLTGAPSPSAPPPSGYSPPPSPQPQELAPWLRTPLVEPDDSYNAASPAFAGPRRMADAPQIIKSIRSLYWLGIVLMSLGLLGFLLGGTQPGKDPAERIAVLLFIACLLGVNIWLLIAVPKGMRTAYYVQAVLSALGLTGFPIGTLLHGYILYHWIKPETKAWFGVR